MKSSRMVTTSSPTTCLMATLPLSHVAQLKAYLTYDVGVGIEYNSNVVPYVVSDDTQHNYWIPIS